MAEVRKKNNKEVKVKKSVIEKKNDKKDNQNIKKRGFFANIRVFFHGVSSEFKKVHWPTKENMLKYSIATIFFIIFCGAFFYLIDILFALIRSLF